MSDDGVRKQSNHRLQYTYLADELGTIMETHTFLGDGASPAPALGPYRRPMRPMFIDTPQKLDMWRSYWDNVESWWEGERSNERRESWR